MFIQALLQYDNDNYYGCISNNNNDDDDDGWKRINTKTNLLNCSLNLPKVKYV